MKRTTKNPERIPPVEPPRSLVLSSAGDLRIGPVLAIPDILRDLGVKPRPVFEHAGVDLELFADPNSRIAFDDLGRLFDACVTATRCGAFGLLVGDRFDLKALGPIGYLMRHSATVGDALRNLLVHLHLHDRGAAPLLLTINPRDVVFGYSIYRHETPATAQIYDAAVAIGHRILRELCAPSWKPLRVQFSHAEPDNREPYREVFGPEVRFDAEVSGIVFDRFWIQRPIVGADAALYHLIEKAIRQSEAAEPMSFAEQVESVLPQMVLSGTATAAAVAQLFAVHERTLRRRLADDGKKLQRLINEGRFELAQQLLHNTGLSVSEIAAALHYSDPNAFSRAFTNWSGLSPTRWRARA